MDFVKTQFDRISQQLAGLNASQRMLTASLVAIMVMTLIWWGRYAGQPERVPLLDMAMPAEDLARIPAHLAAKGIDAQVVGDRIMVPAEQHRHALADLTYSRMMPKNTASAFDGIMKQMSIYDSPDKQRAMWNEAKQARLAQIIMDMEGVEDAAVIIDGQIRRGLQNRADPRATINIRMRPGLNPNQHLVNAAADLVCGSQQGLKIGEVRVVINSKPFRPYDKDGEGAIGSGGELFDQLVAREQYYSAKIQEMLQNVPNAIVTVHCKINHKVTQETRHTINKDNVIEKARTIREETEEVTSREPLHTEPGAMPNTSIALDEPAAQTAENNQARNTSEIENHIDYEKADIITRDGGGDFAVLGASIRLPRSHFVNVFKQRAGSAGGTAEPGDAELESLMNEEVANLREAVRVVTQIPTTENVQVTLFTDMLPPADQAEQVAGTSLPLALGTHAKEIAVGVLALVSLGMVMMMVRRSAPPVPVMAAMEATVPARLPGADDVAGEVGEGNPMLDAVELDEDAVRTQQMIDQVQTMVQENPDAAATLVKRWLNRA